MGGVLGASENTVFALGVPKMNGTAIDACFHWYYPSPKSSSSRQAPPKAKLASRMLLCVSQVCAVLVLCGASAPVFLNSCFISPLSPHHRRERGWVDGTGAGGGRREEWSSLLMKAKDDVQVVVVALCTTLHRCSGGGGGGGGGTEGDVSI